jgi:hypothetical protein
MMMSSSVACQLSYACSCVVPILATGFALTSSGELPTLLYAEAALQYRRRLC